MIITNDWRLWLASMLFAFVLTILFMTYIWWTDRKLKKGIKKGREIDYQNCDGYFLCVFTKGGGCDLHRVSEVKQVVSSLNKDTINVIMTDGDVTQYEDVVSYEFKHVLDLSLYNLYTVKRVTE